MRLLTEYQNGNETVMLFDDGTKIRETNDDEFMPEYPENCDVTISTCCNNGCAFCYMGCTPDGKFAAFRKHPFLDHMFPGMEMAINLNFPKHPHLIEFLEKMKEQGVFVNATVNENHFMTHIRFLKDLTDRGLLHGIGISYTGSSIERDFLNAIKLFPNAIVHVIAGYFDQIAIRRLSDHGIKLLILGYKKTGRGEDYYRRHEQEIEDKIRMLEDQILDLTDHFKLISFDNLAIEQLHIKDKISPRDWDERYQGEEGSVTFYIDLVDGTFARDSLIDEHFPIGDKSLKEMFQIIREKYA